MTVSAYGAFLTIKGQKFFTLLVLGAGAPCCLLSNAVRNT
jgi:hypothetical protein